MLIPDFKADMQLLDFYRLSAMYEGKLGIGKKIASEKYACYNRFIVW